MLGNPNDDEKALIARNQYGKYARICRDKCMPGV